MSPRAVFLQSVEGGKARILHPGISFRTVFINNLFRTETESICTSTGKGRLPLPHGHQ